jgi:hypothetical protein
VIDARDKLTGLIRRAIEDEARLELATSPGKPTPRGGHDTTWMFAQDGTATFLTIQAAWYPDSASLDLAGPAVERADEAFWVARGLHRSRKNVTHGPLQCRLFVPYADGDRIDLLRGVLPALLAPYRQDAGPAPDAGRRTPASARQLDLYKFDVIAVTTVNVRAGSEDQARAMIAGLNSIATRTSGDDIEAGYGLEVSTSDYDVLEVSPRGRGYLVSAETPGGREISVSADELIPEPILAADLAGLSEDLADAGRALADDSNDAGHDALLRLAEALRGLTGGSGHAPADERSLHAGLDFSGAPVTSPTAGSTQTPASSTAAAPAARTSQVPSRGRRR